MGQGKIKALIHRELLIKFNDGVYRALVKHEAMIAGGAITSLVTGQKVNDIDIYFHNQLGFDEVNDAFKADKDYIEVCNTNNAITYRDVPLDQDIQLIKINMAEDAYNLISTFDMFHNAIAFTCGLNTLATHPNFEECIIQRKLMYNPKAKYPISSLQRIFKYLQRGYTISNFDLAMVALKIASLNIKNREDLERELRGIDTDAFNDFMSTLSNIYIGS